jgi:REP element-mobilizing transposase RayT
MPAKFDPQKHHRRSIRLKGYDYAQPGAYFVTIVTYQRECLFGEIVDGEMQLNEYGKIVQKWWNEIPNHFPNVEIVVFVIMPNHVHGIILISADRRGTVPVPGVDDKTNVETENLGGETPNRGERTSQSGGETPPLRAPTLGQIVAYFKYQSTKEMNALDGTGTITKFWQRNYYERIIRGEKEMGKIWDYIETNPLRWADDDENPVNNQQ